jgi:deazaflavin-dependent oxidoreductase (nitroreductase family)
MYRGGRPRGLARMMNAVSAWMYADGRLTSERGATLEVVGRRSGKPITLPVVVTDYDGSDYLVSTLGDDANWVRNVRAACGAAVLIRQRRQSVHLVEMPVDQRSAILRRYLEVAPGARPHIPVSRKAPLTAFMSVSESYPVFRIDHE